MVSLIRSGCLSFLLILSVSFVSAQSIDPAAAGMSAERLERYTDYLQKEIDTGKVPGAVSMIYRKGQIAHYEAYGYSNLAEKTPMQKDQIFFIQSMTKAIVTTGFMMLYEEGHFQLNDPVEWYLPQFKDPVVALDPQAGKEGETEPAKSPIRIIHLLTHTAGLSHGLGPTKLDRDYRQAMYMSQPKSIEERVNAMAELPLIGHPGEQWYYSASPGVLSRLIEVFSGQSTAEFLQERLFDPLEMEDTGYNIPSSEQSRMASLHLANGEGQVSLSPQQTPMEGNTVFGGGNGLFSTARDYIRFCQLFLNEGQANGHQLLSPKTIELMTQNHVGDLYTDPGYGFSIGFGIVTDLSDTRKLGSVGQIAWSGAFRTYFFIDPQEELAAVLLTQVTPYSGFYGNKMQQFIYQAIVD